MRQPIARFKLKALIRAFDDEQQAYVSLDPADVENTLRCL